MSIKAMFCDAKFEKELKKLIKKLQIKDVKTLIINNKLPPVNTIKEKLRWKSMYIYMRTHAYI